MAGLYSHTTRATGTVLTAAIYNADHQNHIDNFIPTQMDDYSSDVAQMQAVSDPGEVGSESQATSIAGEIERLRFMIKEILGEAQWYASSAANLTHLEKLVGLVGLNGLYLQSFVLAVTNSGGNIQHRFGIDLNFSALGNHAAKINGASNAFQITPTGANGSTAFTTGAKRNSAATSEIILDTGDITLADFIGLATIEYNASGTSGITVAVEAESLDVNGTTRRRLHLKFYNGNSDFAIDTANLTAGETIYIRVLAFLP